jgi:hypothetical protein
MLRGRQVPTSTCNSSPPKPPGVRPWALVASSDHPQEAGTGGRLVALLCAAGAAVDGPAGDGSPLATALAFGTLDCADVLLARDAHRQSHFRGGGREDDVAARVAGRLEVTSGPPIPHLAAPSTVSRSIAAPGTLVLRRSQASPSRSARSASQIASRRRSETGILFGDPASAPRTRA